MYHDPYSNEQIKAYRQDPTGRFIPITEDDDIEPDSVWFLIIGGALFGIILAVMLFMGV